MTMHATPIGGTALLGALAVRFTDRATIYAAVETNTKGDVAISHSSVRAGHSDIPAIAAPGNVGNARMKREEMMSSAITTESEYRYVKLAGAWPLIDRQDELELNSEGIRWAIVAIDIDQTSTFTQLYCERMSPGNI